MEDYFWEFNEEKTLGELTTDFKKRLDDFAESDKGITGIRSGFHELDAITKGFQPGQLVLVGGAVAMGKSSFAHSLIKEMAIEKRCPIGYISLDLSAEQVMMRMISMYTKIDNQKLNLGLLDENETKTIDRLFQQFSSSSLSIVEYPFRTVAEIGDKINEFVHYRHESESTKVIIIDSLELIASKQKDKVGSELTKKDLAKITIELKNLSLKFNVTIIALFTLLKVKKKRDQSYRPQLYDVRKLAPIDRYTDLILLLYRPEYYKIDEWDDELASSTAGQAEIVIAKNKYGIRDYIRVQFDGRLGKFDNLPYNGNSDIPF